MRKTFLLKLAAVAIGIFISLVMTEIFLRVQNFVQLDNFSNQSPWSNVFHHGQEDFTVKEYGLNCNDGKIKLLLLGDSWMEDKYKLSTTIGQEISEKSQKCVQAVNGSSSSYAPTVYLLKARRAFKNYGKFDYIVVNIDETDIGDEWLRYRIPTIRDASGQIVAVPYEHDIAAQYLWNGKLWAENSHFYIVRLLKFSYFYKFLVPSLYKFTASPDLYANLMQFVFAPDAHSVYKQELEHFQGRLLEMTSEISSFVNKASHVYITHHPHRQGLISDTDKTKLYLPIVSESLAQLKIKSEVSVLDARNYARQIHGTAFPRNTYLENDPFSHLNGEGAVRYGKWIVSQIEL